ncbi:carbamoyl phosphate synthase small subunit [Acidaminobacterium chupaoyuni]
MDEPIYLVLENGTVMEGRSFGAYGEITGEIVFTTGMTGYLETLTDPSYYGQIVVQTFPLIGNYGVIPSDFESARPQVRAYVVRNVCEMPSNFRCEGDLSSFLAENGIIGLAGIDTRRLTKLIRTAGVMNGKIVCSRDAIECAKQELASYRIVDAVESVTCSVPRTDTPEDPHRRVVLYDFGAKENIRRELLKRGCEVITVPAHTPAAEALEMKPDGIMLSNGPGDPAENTEIIRQVGLLYESGVPLFGICLGHQLLALSQGAETEKLKYGHRGANQPVKVLSSGRTYITSQNHGYAVKAETLPDHALLSMVNANDGTCEGVSYQNRPVFTVQFHPEACGGPHDTAFLFDEFVERMEANR